ncbi:MAG: DUF732 domain-containing protein, partial [Actinomycetia bacterium]|nr:DUF732 domain-containing protein [Actinomycetes bacterium]
AALGLAVAAVGLSAPASANDDVGAYLQYLADHGINTGWRNTTSGNIVAGRHACDLLRSGMSVDQIVADAAFVLADVRGITLAAQQTLCPDTL